MEENWETIKVRKETKEGLNAFKFSSKDTDEDAILRMRKLLNSDRNKKKIEQKIVLLFFKENGGKVTFEQIKMLFKDKNTYEINELMAPIIKEGTIFQPKIGEYKLMDWD